MITGLLEYKNKIYLFKSNDDNLEISLSNHLVINEQGLKRLNKFKDVFKIDINNINLDSQNENYNCGLYVYGITSNYEYIVFNIAYMRTYQIFTDNKKFKINYYYKLDNSVVNRYGINNKLYMTIAGNDIRNFYNIFENWNIDNIVTLPSIACYEYIHNNDVFKVDVGINEIKKLEINKLERYNVLNFEIYNTDINYIENIPELVYKIYYGCLNFLRYICRKKYLDIDNYTRVTYTYGDTIYTCTFVYCGNEFKQESNKNYEDKIINYRYIRDTEFISKLFQLCINENIYLNHLPETIDTRWIYSPSRILETFSVFENEYNYYIGNQDKDNNNKKQEIIDEITIYINKLDEKYNGNDGKKRKYIKEFRKKLNELQYSRTLFDKFYMLFEQNKDILECNFSNDEINKICDNLTNTRNAFTHGRISIQNLNIDNFKFVEMIIYVMRLKKLGVTPNEIKVILKALF